MDGIIKMIVHIVTHPNARNPRVEKDLLDTIHVYTKQPPLEGKANKEAIESLATYFHVKKSSVILLSGHTSKHKRVEIKGI